MANLNINGINRISNFVEKLFSAGVIIDDHSKKEIEWAPRYIGVHKKPRQKEEIVWVSDKCQYFSVNEIYMDEEGKFHLGTRSTGGVVDLRNHEFSDAVLIYNHNHMVNKSEWHLSILERKEDEIEIFIP